MPHHTAVTGRILLVAAALLLGLSVSMQFTFAFWGDQDWELLVSAMWLDGKKLYVDHVPVTAPLLFYLYALPVLLSRNLAFLQDYQALALLAVSAIALVIAISTRLISSHLTFATPSRKLQFILLLAFLLLFRIAPPYFADREHILITLTLPYLLRWMPGLDVKTPSLRLRLLIGLMAAVGFFIKPHCLLLFAAIQFICIVRLRSVRILISPENIVIYIFGALYGASVWYFTPEYLTLVLPMAYHTYSAIQGSPGGYYALAISVALTFIMLRPGGGTALRRDIYYLSALLPFCFLYARINNGWAYSYQPLMTLLLLTNGFVLWEFLELRRKAPRAWRPALGVLSCLLNFALETGYTLYYFHSALRNPCHGDKACAGYYQPFLDEIHAAPQARSFGALGEDFSLWARTSKLSGAQWVTRFPQLWMIPRFYIADDAFYAAHQDILNYAANALADDLERKEPDIVFVEVTRNIYSIRLRRTVDWPGDLSATPAFRQAWEHYRLTHAIDCGLAPVDEALEGGPEKPQPQSSCRYDVYRRLP